MAAAMMTTPATGTMMAMRSVEEEPLGGVLGVVIEEVGLKGELLGAKEGVGAKEGAIGALGAKEGAIGALGALGGAIGEPGGGA